VVRGRGGVVEVAADHVLVCAGGLATPVLLSRSIGEEAAFCMGYHDHPMAYVAKVHLRADSRLKSVSCTTTQTAEVRAGLVYESDGVKTVVYLRPALNLSLRSIQGAARYILSDLRNDPFSPKKIFQLLTNLEAVREAVLFKSKAGFRGDYYSVLLLGEQTPIATRGLALAPGQKPTLNWHVTEAERRAYATSFQSFLQEFSGDILAKNEIPTAKWEFRTAAHHSGAANRFLSDPGELSLEFFSVKGLSNTFVCDSSLLRAAGIANSGLTLVALGHRLAELISNPEAASSAMQASA
jgi:choline dehydrogenase-like flavoprotein